MFRVFVYYLVSHTGMLTSKPRYNGKIGKLTQSAGKYLACHQAVAWAINYWRLSARVSLGILSSSQFSFSSIFHIVGVLWVFCVVLFSYNIKYY